MASEPRLSVLDEFVESEDHRRLFLRSWRPRHIRAIVAIVHDRGSDSSRYRRFAHVLAACGIAAYAIDLRGCGRSPGARFQLRSIDGWICDTRTMLSLVRERDPMKPLFLFGHGTGALAACLHALRHEDQLDGLICEGIVLDRSWTGMLLRILGVLLPTSFVRAGSTLLRSHDRRREFSGCLSLPLLLLHGSRDVTAPPSGSEYLHGAVSSSDKTLQVFEGCHHDLINGSGHAIVRAKTCRWIEAQLDSSAGRCRIGIEYINE